MKFILLMSNDNNLCDEKQYEQIYRLYAKDLRDFLIYKFKDKQTAEDVVHECFIKLWKICNKVPVNKAKSFIFTVGNNMFLNIKKHEKVIRQHRQKASKQDKNHISPEFILIEEEYARKLEKLINDLPEKQKQVFWMSRIDKKKYSEIADELQISIKTVEKRMSAALKFLRNNLEYFK